MQLMFTLLDYYSMLIVPIKCQKHIIRSTVFIACDAFFNRRQYIILQSWLADYQPIVARIALLIPLLTFCILLFSFFFCLAPHRLSMSFISCWCRNSKHFSDFFERYVLSSNKLPYIFSWIDNSIHFFQFFIYSRLLRVQ